MTCKYAEDTGEKWAGSCKCRKIKCNCRPRKLMLLDRVLKDTVDFHTQVDQLQDVYVREKWCCKEKCSFYCEKGG